MQDQTFGKEYQSQAVKCPQCGASLSPSNGDTSICQYCGSSIIWVQKADKNGMPITEKAVHGYKLKRIRCTDPEANGLEAFNMLAPMGWNVKGGVKWNLQNIGMPASISYFVSNPRGPEAFEVLPNMNLVWNPSAIFNIPGGHHFGAEIQKPVSIHDAFKKFVIPRYRSQAQNISILNEEIIPDLPKAVKSDAVIDPIGSAEGGKIRIRYTWNNYQFDEEIYGVVEIFRTPIMTGFGTSIMQVWFIDYLFSLRAAADKLDSLTDLFTVMVHSIKPNVEWYTMFKTVAKQLARGQIDRMIAIGNAGRIYAQAGAEMRAESLQEWYTKQEAFDRHTVDWSRAIRDVDGFYDPHKEEVVELPSGYGHAWANNLGEYIVTEDALFNPNENSNLHWESMSPQ